MKLKAGDLVKIKKRAINKLTTGTNIGTIKKISGSHSIVIELNNGKEFTIWDGENCLKKIILEPFDLERAKAGEPIYSISGVEAKEFQLIKDPSSQYAFQIRFENQVLPIAYRASGNLYDGVKGVLYMRRIKKKTKEVKCPPVPEHLVEEAKKEYIICSAIHYDDKKKHAHQPRNIYSGAVVCGKRHHNCIATMSALTTEPQQYKLFEVEQGFLTNSDYFVNRFEALKIARNAGQILDENKVRGSQLYSEDIY